jgi:hypothetical protein
MDEQTPQPESQVYMPTMFRLQSMQTALNGLLAADSTPADWPASHVVAVALNYADVCEAMIMMTPAEIEDYLIKHVLGADNVIRFPGPKKPTPPNQPGPIVG